MGGSQMELVFLYTFLSTFSLPLSFLIFIAPTNYRYIIAFCFGFIFSLFNKSIHYFPFFSFLPSLLISFFLSVPFLYSLFWKLNFISHKIKIRNKIRSRDYPASTTCLILSFAMGA